MLSKVIFFLRSQSSVYFFKINFNNNAWDQDDFGEFSFIIGSAIGIFIIVKGV